MTEVFPQSTWRFPYLDGHQQGHYKDFLRLIGSIEGTLARLAEQFLVDPDLEGGAGIVLWGLQTIDSSTVDNPRRYTVTKGAALVPHTAGDRRWHLAILANDHVSSLSPGASRRDLVELRITDVEEESEIRTHRVVGPGGEQAVHQPTNTMRRPAGAVFVNAGVGMVAPAVTAGAVKLATVDLDADGRVDAVADWRQHLFEKKDFSGVRGLRQILIWLRNRVGGVVDLDNGGLKASIPVAAGGPNVELVNGGGVDAGNTFLNLLGRRLRATVAPVVAGLRPVRQVVEGAGFDPADYTNDADGLKINGSTVIRAFACVSVGVAPTWSGQNIESVIRTSDGIFDVRFSEGIFAAHGDLSVRGRWNVRAYPINNGFTGGPFGPRVISVTRSIATHARAVQASVWSFNDGTGAWERTDTEMDFRIEIIGPATFTAFEDWDDVGAP